jgi:membrane-associated phospholipid phosphatase
MNRRLIIYSILVSLALTLLSIFFFDQPIAAFVQRAGGRSSAFLLQGTSFLEVISGFPLAKYALTYALLAAGLILQAWKSTRSAAWTLLFIGGTQCTTRLIAGTLKGVFERLRPFEVIQAGDWDCKFFSGHGNSFPSGHSAHFWGLFFPLAYLFPRYRIPLSIIPLFISVARVGVNDHWCSDVLGSIAIAAAVTLLFISIFRVKPVQNAETPVVIPSRSDGEGPIAKQRL